MRLFGSERIAAVMDRFGHQEGEVIQHPIVTKSIERAQRKVEEQNFATRKRLLEYDNVMNQQREIIYARRRNALFKDRLRLELFDLLRDYADQLATKYYDNVEIDQLREQLLRELSVEISFTEQEWQQLGKDGVADKIYQTAAEFYKRKEEHLGSDMMGRIERFATLSVIDEKWREHLRDIDDLKEGINLRAYGQKDPLLEYKQEAFKLFVDMLESIGTETLSLAFKLYPVVSPQRADVQLPKEPKSKVRRERLVATHAEATSAYSVASAKQQAQSDIATEEVPKQMPIRVEKAPGRNDPCPCGSGKKYKHCHGRA
jgi:preprotein translocase subunit SecA